LRHDFVSAWPCGSTLPIWSLRSACRHSLSTQISPNNFTMCIIRRSVGSPDLPSFFYHNDQVLGESAISRVPSAKDVPLLVPVDWTRRHNSDHKFSRPLRLAFDADQGHDMDMQVEDNQWRRDVRLQTSFSHTHC
jgi:hypothetical protein